MSYQPPSPGYPAPQPPTGYGAPAAPPPVAVPEGPSTLPRHLTLSVAILGLLAYLFSFGPLFNINTSMGPFGGAELTASGMGYWTIAALVAALLAGVSLIARKSYAPIVAVSAVLGVLLVVGQVVNRPSVISIGWALWIVLLLTLAQAAAAIAAVLYESGVLRPPAPRPRYDQYGPYGPPPGGYYAHPGVAAPGQPGVQAAGYPAPQQSAGGPVGTVGTVGTVGYASQSYQADANLDTPPTGFPSLGQQPAQPSDPSGPAQS